MNLYFGLPNSGFRDGALPVKLRKMQSLLKVTSTELILQHASFPDFLLSPARSGKYYISHSKASKRFLELFSKALIGYASIARQSLYVSSSLLRFGFVLKATKCIDSAHTTLRILRASTLGSININPCFSMTAIASE
jgi:hypothetical protein